MVRLLSTFLVTGVLSLIFVFQNCSQPAHREISGQSVNLSAMYPYYEQKPTFYENVQLTSVVNQSSLWVYQFVASVVSIDTPASDVDVDIRIFDQQNNILCPRYTATVRNTSNHIEIPDCTSPKKISKAKIEVRAKMTMESTYRLVNTYDFEL